MKPITKVIRLELLKPVNADWKEIGQKLRDLQKLTAQALNYCMRDMYLKAADRYEELIKQDIKPAAKEFKGIIGSSYTKVLGERFFYGKHPSYVYDQIADIARHRFKNDWFDILVSGKVSLPSYRRDNPLYIRANGVSLREEEKNDDYVDRSIGLKLFSDTQD
ncbi:hypothetical protein KKA08_09585, partial [bacterium]|nr:hypothetical protein [bacterium]